MSASKKSRPRRNNRNCRIEFEALAARHLLAGITFDSATGIVTVDGSNSADSVLVTQNASSVTIALTNVQTQTFPTVDLSKIRFYGRGGDDWFRNNSSVPVQAYGQAGLDTLIGGSANDILRGGGEADRLYGQAGNDSLIGDAGDDVSFGGSGHDRADSGAGNDRITGEDGDDKIFAGEGDDYVDAGNGNDQVYTWWGNDYVLGGAGDDLISGHDGNDNLNGQSGIDQIYGNEGDDRLTGGAQDDRLVGGNGADSLLGDDGWDALFGQGGNDWMAGGLGDDALSGEAGDDRMRGEGGADDLWGGEGNDDLAGDDGDDLLAGGGGDDSLSGNNQNDLLLGDDGNDSISGGSGSDSCQGGNGLDNLSGDDGDDHLNGGNDNDDLSGGSGSDSLSGGSGNDDYSTDVSDSLDDSSDDYAADGDFEIRGIIENLDTTAKTFTIEGIAVNYSQSEVKGQVANGAFFKAEGTFLNQVLNAHEVQPEDAQDGHDAFEAIGLIANLDTASQTFSFLGLTVSYATAEVHSVLANGALVKVEGALVNGQVAAREVGTGFNDNDSQVQRNFELRGAIENLDSAARTFTLLGVAVNYGSSQVNGTLVNGGLVKVEGQYLDGALTAREVQSELPDDRDENVEASGEISQLDTAAQTFSLLGIVIHYAGADIEVSLANGLQVSVEGWFEAGVIAAEEVR